ncbi:hypothetical protein ATY77_24850 [Rhizobium sp. R634]|nr:hypothetical protein ATY77_24850 [Rhizobium sp. R634]
MLQRDGADGASSNASPASVAEVGAQLGKKRAADAGPETDRLLKASFSAGLASDAALRQAAIADRSDMGEAIDPIRNEDRLRARCRAFTAESAFAPAEIERR